MKSEIEIPVAELKSALHGLSKIIGRSRTIPVLNSIKISLDKDQQAVTLQATNLDEIATYRVASPGKGASGEVLIPLETVAKIIKGCSPEQSIWFIGDKKETKIRYVIAGNLVDRVVEYLSPQEWPTVKVIHQDSFLLDASFKLALKEALDSASTDSSRYVLNGACLDVSDQECHCVVGTDGRHLYSANTFRFQIPESLIVPTQKFVAWSGFQNDGQWKLRMLPAVKADPEDKRSEKAKEEPAWFEIRSDHWTYIARAVDGTYPNWRQVVPNQTSKWNRVVLADESVRMMQQAVPMLPGADTVNQPVVLEFADNKLWVKGRGKDDKQDTTMTVPEAQVTGEPFKIALNRIYLLRALRFGFKEIRIADELSPLVFSSANKTMVVMPLRLDGAPTPVEPAPVQTTPASESITISPQNEENAAAALPSEVVVDNSTGSTGTQDMSTTTTATDRANGHVNGNGSANGEAQENRSSFKAALDHIERIKINLRDVIGDLNEAVSMLKAAEKEQRATSREIDSVRNKLREIQAVKL
jgi:DNA polymerase III sliding clamp (beta) subunit (PCNA family)/exonuclease VII small subunit